jgi:hypothetical protein
MIAVPIMANGRAWGGDMCQKVMENWLKAKISNPVTDEMSRDGNALMICVG